MLALPLEQSTVAEALSALSGVIGEKLAISRLAVVKSSGTVAAYSHAAGRIGVLVAVDKTDSYDLAREIAMQVAASDPKYIEPSEVPSQELDKEKEVYAEQLKAEGKPEAMIEKIVQGKINKYYEGVCLTHQEYIKDDKKKISDILGQVKIETFVRFSL